MAEFVPLAARFVPVIAQGVDAAKTFSKAKGLDAARTSRLAIEQLQARQNLEEQDAVTKANADRAAIEAASTADEARRVAALKRAVARQRASFGGRGIDPDEGSAEAVLLGLFEESDAEKAERDGLDAIRKNAIDDRLDSLRQRNLLELSQLSARQDLARRIRG